MSILVLECKELRLRIIKASLIISAAFVVLMGLVHTGASQGRHEKREAKVEESAKPKAVSGAVTLQTDLPYERAYDSILNHLKRHDYTIDSASKDIGQIVTAMTIKGGYSQTGTRVYVTLIKDSETSTTVKVAVAEQKRKKLFQTEPWGDPKVNSEKSTKLAEEIKSALKSQ